ncbi:glutaminyl-peptide cyclotransferase [Streptomyces sp. NPDC060031]|uniref:glutaminyl-peptide cyclotransferase n=1 Tax=Streptomyces sp. NPDC060031 TaxID=3347043 RepID=UPI0036AAA644
MADDTLYEGTGISGRPSVRAGRPGKKPTARAALPAPFFGEGITVLGRTLWQLTWRNRTAIERDARTLAELRRVPSRPGRRLGRVPPAGPAPAADQRRLVTADVP